PFLSFETDNAYRADLWKYGYRVGIYGHNERVQIIADNSSYTSLEQRVRIQTFGSELVLTDPDKGMGGAIKKAYQILENTRDAFMLQQFENPVNVKAHFETTGPKIWEDTLGQVDIFVMGIGSGGTVWCGQIPQVQESQCQGHGGSDGLLGYVPSLDHVVADTVASHPDVESILEGVILTSPALCVRPTHPIFGMITLVFSLFLPKFQFSGANKRGILVSRDPVALVAKYSDL
ncbi:hypothetical protein KI387_019196, partial [Taxus chinensis]